MRKPIVNVLAALTLSAAFAVPAVAAEEETASVEVKTSDLDLTTPAGTKTLEARIDNALDRVCARPDVRNIKAMQAFQACQAEARDAAMQQLSLSNPFDGVELASFF